jgi:hypothetical protein
MKRSNRNRHRPEEVVAKLRQADEALAKGTPNAEVAKHYLQTRDAHFEVAIRGGAGQSSAARSVPADR